MVHDLAPVHPIVRISLAVGTLHSARFRFECIGGRQPLRVRLAAYMGDDVPNRRFTPVIAPA